MNSPKSTRVLYDDVDVMYIRVFLSKGRDIIYDVDASYRNEGETFECKQGKRFGETVKVS